MPSCQGEQLGGDQLRVNGFVFLGFKQIHLLFQLGT